MPRCLPFAAAHLSIYPTPTPAPDTTTYTPRSSLLATPRRHSRLHIHTIAHPPSRHAIFPSLQITPSHLAPLRRWAMHRRTRSPIYAYSIKVGMYVHGKSTYMVRIHSKDARRKKQRRSEHARVEAFCVLPRTYPASGVAKRDAPECDTVRIRT